MPKPFAKLRARLVEREITQLKVARELNLSSRWVNAKMTAHAPWTLDEMYALMELVECPTEQMHELFPRGGTLRAAREKRKAVGRG